MKLTLNDPSLVHVVIQLKVSLKEWQKRLCKKKWTSLPIQYLSQSYQDPKLTPLTKSWYMKFKFLRINQWEYRVRSNLSLYWINIDRDQPSSGLLKWKYYAKHEIINMTRALDNKKSESPWESPTGIEPMTSRAPGNTTEPEEFMESERGHLTEFTYDMCPASC